MPEVQFDSFDIQILSALQRCNQTTAQDLAEQVPLSPSAIVRRIRGYRETGVIAADVSVIYPRATGDRISVVLFIQLEEQGAAAVAAFRAEMERALEIQVVMEMAGSYDFMLIGVFPSMARFNAFADEAIADHPAVRRYEASFVRRRVKFGTHVPL